MTPLEEDTTDTTLAIQHADAALVLRSAAQQIAWLAGATAFKTTASDDGRTCPFALDKDDPGLVDFVELEEWVARQPSAPLEAVVRQAFALGLVGDDLDAVLTVDRLTASVWIAFDVWLLTYRALMARVTTLERYHADIERQAAEAERRATVLRSRMARKIGDKRELRRRKKLGLPPCDGDGDVSAETEAVAAEPSIDNQVDQAFAALAAHVGEQLTAPADGDGPPVAPDPPKAKKKPRRKAAKVASADA